MLVDCLRNAIDGGGLQLLRTVKAAGDQQAADEHLHHGIRAVAGKALGRRSTQVPAENEQHGKCQHRDQCGVGIGGADRKKQNGPTENTQPAPGTAALTEQITY